MAMSERDKQIAFYGLPAAILGALFWFGYYADDSWLNNYDAMGAEIEKKDEQLHEALMEERNLDALSEEVELMRGELVIAEKLLPRENDVRGLLQKIPQLVAEAGIPANEISSISFNSQMLHDQYKEWPIALQFGNITFPQVVELLYKFEQFERLLDVIDLPLGLKSSEDNTMTLGLVINVYVLRESEPAESAAE